MPGVPTRTELFDPELLAEVQRLRIVARRVPQGGRFAEQRSPRARHGHRVPRDHRPYAPGDDLRTVDWHLYKRFGRVFCGCSRSSQDLPLYVLPDVSRSLFLEEAAARRRVPALRAGAGRDRLGQHDTVGAFPFSDDCEVLVAPQAGPTA